MPGNHSGGYWTAPTQGQWGLLVLLDHECILWSKDDRKCFFYVLAIPKFGWPLVINKAIDGKHIGRTRDRLYWLAARVIGMGWMSAVGVIMHLHRNMLLSGRQLPRSMALDPTWQSSA